MATPFFLYYSRFSIFYAMKNNVELEMKTSTVEPSINLFPQHYDHQFLYHGPIARCPVDHHLTGHIHVFSVLWIGFTSLLEYVLSFLLELFSKDSHPIPQILLSSSLLALTMILARDTYKIPNRKNGYVYSSIVQYSRQGLTLYKCCFGHIQQCAVCICIGNGCLIISTLT